MKVLNIHSRVISQPKAKVAELLATLASKDDQIWPNEKWPAMRISGGLKEGAAGGHGPIRYTIQQYLPGELIRFKFSQPKGYHGIHQLEIIAQDATNTQLRHVIDMEASGVGVLTWVLAIRWLHDALIEDAFDKVENHFSQMEKTTAWTSWVKFLRWLLK